jgi:hypothetical protein
MKTQAARIPLFLSETALLMNSPFPFFLNEERKNVGLAAAVSAFVMGFMVLYRPFQQFDIQHTPGSAALYSAVIFVVMTIGLVAMPRIFPRIFDTANWTFKKYVVFTVWLCFFIGLACIVIDKVFVCPEHSWVRIAGTVYAQVLLTGALPITVITIWLKYRMLATNLQKASSANQQIDKIGKLKNGEALPTAKLFTISSETSETLELHLPDLLYVEANDNYSTFYWNSETGVQKRILRVNLKAVENQLNNSYTLRCHRSYLVNIYAIAQVSGNTNGYKLHIRHTTVSIPVARPKGKLIMDKISELRNMMELY